MAVLNLDRIIIFGDGACSGNPGPGGWASIVILPEGRVAELGSGDPATTNNKMEMTAVLEALRYVSTMNAPVAVYTDSVYVIRGITQWVFGWQKRGWLTAEGNAVANQELWQELSGVVRARAKSGPITWHYVRGHTGVPGNERCDVVSVQFSKGDHVELYHGSLENYPVDILSVPDNTDLPEMKPMGEAKAKPVSYLSLHGGVAMRHASWSECERRVKGQSGAKFKKAMSAADELSILKSWGVDPTQLKK